MSTVSVAVMAHPRRERFIPELLEQLDRPAEVVWDQNNDRWDTGARSLLAYSAQATHHLVIQDDAIPCADLVAGLEAALDSLKRQTKPTPLGLYLSKASPYVRTQHTWPASVRWVRKQGLASGVGLVMPVELINAAVAWGASRRDISNYDTRVSRWLARQDIPVWHTWPSLVDHRNSPSLVPGRTGRGRHAGNFLGASASALSVDWASGEVRDVTGPTRQRQTVPSTKRQRRIVQARQKPRAGRG